MTRRVKGFVNREAKLPYISCHDIGEAAAIAFDSPEKWQSMAVNLVADYASGQDVCEALTRLRPGQRFRYSAPPALLMRIFVPEFYKMRQGFEEAGQPPFPHQAAIDAARAATSELIPVPRSLEQHLKAAGFAERTL